MLLVTGISNAQYFVNSQIGSDGRNGLSATIPDPDDGITGPKLTLTNALAAMVAGQTVTVAATPVNYPEALVVMDKNVTVIASGGTPVFVNAVLRINEDCEFQGNFSFSDLDLNQANDDVTFSSGTLTITNDIDVDAQTSQFFGTLAVTGGGNRINYNVDYTTGDEFPATGVEDVVLAAGVTVDLSANKTINEDLVLGAGATFDVNANTFTLSGAACKVDLTAGGANVIGSGTVAFTLTGPGLVQGGAGFESMPNVSATSSNGSLLTIDIAIEDIGDLTANGNADITAQNTGNVNDVTNNGDGDITVENDGEVEDVTVAGDGDIDLDATAAASGDVNSILVSGLGNLTFNGSGANLTDITVQTTVMITTSYDISGGVVTGAASITFPNLPTTVLGTTTNSYSQIGTATATNNDNNGIIWFQAIDNDVALGNVVNESSGDPDNDGTAGDSDNNGNIVFDFDGAGANTFTAGDVTNSSAWTVDATNSGRIYFTAGWSHPVTVGDVLNNSTSIAGNGLIDFNTAARGPFIASSLTTTGASNSGDGTYSIRLGNQTIGGAAASVDINGDVICSRSIAGAGILFDFSVTNNDMALGIDGNVTNSGPSDIDFLFQVNTPDDVLIGGVITNSGSGSVFFNNLQDGTFSADGITVSNGLVDLDDFTGVGGNLDAGIVDVSGGTLDASGMTAGNFTCDSFTLSGGSVFIQNSGGGDVLINGDASFTDGTLDVLGIDDVIISGYNITVGGPTTNPTFNNTGGIGGVAFVLAQPIPNNTQILTIGANFPQWGGDLEITNAANIADVVSIQGGNWTIFGDVTFNTATVTNSIDLDGGKLYLGANNVVGSGGTFNNITGYTSQNDGRVVMSGNVQQNVTFPAVTSLFGSFEVDNNSGVSPAVRFNGAGDGLNGRFTDFFYMTEGVIEGQDVDFFSSGGSVPHIVRNDGFFNVAPTFTNMVDVTYIGLEKTTAAELPVATNILRNLTVATTNHSNGGPQAGFGVVKIASDIYVNGTLTVREDQTLLLALGFDIYMQGDDLILEDNAAIASNGFLGTLYLNNPTGTLLDGPGYLPRIRVSNGSVGNEITANILGIVQNLLSADDDRNDGDDDTTPDGDIEFVAGGGASDLTVTFPALGLPPFAHFNNLVLSADDDETFTMLSDVTISGNLTLGGGYLDLSGFTLTHQGTVFTMDASAATSASVIEFVTDGTTMFTTGGTPTISADVWFNVPGGTVNLNGGDNLIIEGNATVMNDGAAVPNGTELRLLAGSNLILTGDTFEVEEDSKVNGAGQLTLARPAPDVLNFIMNDATVVNLEVDGNVLLSGVGTLFVDDFLHTSGTFEFGTADFKIENSYTRIAGDYTGDGWFIWSSPNQTLFDQGATPVAVNNFWMENRLDYTSAGTFTVNDELFIDDALLDCTGATTTFDIGDGTNIPLVRVNSVPGGGVPDVTGAPLNFMSPTADFSFEGTNFYQPSVNVWPAAPSMLANEVSVSNIGDVELLDSRYIGTRLNLLNAQLGFNAPVDLELGNPTLIYLEDAAAELDIDYDGVGFGLAAGTLTAPVVNLWYDNDLNDGTAVTAAGITTGYEYTEPTSVNDFTLTSNFGAVGVVTEVNIDDARTIDGTVSLSSTLNVINNTVFANLLTVPGGSSVDVFGGATATMSNGMLVNGTVNNDAQINLDAGDLTVNGIFNNSFSGLGGQVNTQGNNWPLIVNVGGIYYDNAGTSIFTDITNNGSFFTDDNTNVHVYGNITGAGVFDFAIGPNLGSFATLHFRTTAAVPPAVIDWSGATLLSTNNLDIRFRGGSAVDWSLPGNTTVNDVRLQMSTNDVVTVDGGDLTLNGILTLTKGLIDANGNDIIITLGFATLGGFNYLNTPAGVVRNLADPINDMSHVIGHLAVMTPIAAVGRIDFPVGSTNSYRPAAVEFTTADATEVASLISVGHVDGEAEGNYPLPIDGGQKYQNASLDNPIGGKAPYYWEFTATPSLGVLQQYNIELQADGINKPFDNVYNLRTIGRANGQVSSNSWFVQGANIGTGNILQLNTPGPGDSLIYVRAENATGWLVPQATYYTIGIPTQPPLWAVGGTPADAAINEGDTYTFTYAATNLDANPAALVYSVDDVTPALDPSMYSINGATGDFTFSPDFTTGTTAYTFTIMAAKSNDLNSFTTDQVVITVNNVNLAPSFTDTGSATVATGSVTSGDTFNFTYAAVDADAGDVLTYAIQSIVPAFAGTATISAALGTFAFTPVFADAGQTFTVTITATDAGALVATTTTDITVGYPVAKGDVDADSDVDIDDAQLVLDHVVGNALLTDPQELWAADINDDALYTAVDASRILYFWAYGSFPTWKLSATTASVEFGQFRNEDNLITLPINITNANGVLTFYTEVNLGTELEFVGVTKTQGEGWISSSKFENGILKFVMIGTESLKDGAVAAISVRLKDKEAAIQINASANLNDENSIELNAINLREIPTEFALKQNYPNPFNPTTTIKYAIPENAHVTLVVYDMLGQVVRKLVDNEQEAGFYTMQWDGTSEYGSRVASGIYIYRITAGKYTSTLKMNLLK